MQFYILVRLKIEMIKLYVNFAIYMYMVFFHGIREFSESTFFNIFRGFAIV